MMRKYPGNQRNFCFRNLSILLVAFILIVTMVSSVAAVNLDDMEKEQRDIERQLEEEREELDSMRSKEELLKEELEELDESLEEIESELSQLKKDISRTENEIEATEIKLKEAEERLDYHEGLLKKRLRVMHERGNVSFLEVLLEASSFADFLTRLHYLQLIANNDMLLVQQVEEEREAYFQEKMNLEEQKKELEEMRQTTVESKKKLDRTIEKRAELLAELQEAVKETQQAMDELEKDAQDLAAEIERIQQEQLERAQSEQSSSSSSGSSSGSGSSDSSRGGQAPVSGGRLLWPVGGNCYISSPFGYRSCPFSGRSTFHGGIDIATYGQRNPIYAAEGGTVLFAKYSGGYGNYIMIDHGGGLMTLYAHLSSMHVSTGQSVSRGETIGLAGTTGASTGIHLHFEVWVNGTRVNPMSYLR